MISIPVLISKDTLRDIFDYVAQNIKDGSVCVEIGSFIGGSVCYFGQKVQELGKTVNITCVDTWQFQNISKEHITLVENEDYYAAFLANISKCNLSVQTIVEDSITAAEKIEDKSIDFLFIDGCHEHPYTEMELRAWLPKMKENSIIAGHDYDQQAVKLAVANVLSDFKTIGEGEYYIKQLGTGLK